MCIYELEPLFQFDILTVEFFNIIDGAEKIIIKIF